MIEIVLLRSLREKYLKEEPIRPDGLDFYIFKSDDDISLVLQNSEGVLPADQLQKMLLAGDDLVSNELPAGAAFELSLWLSRRIYQSDMPLFDFLTWTRFCRIFATLFVVGVDEAKMEHAVDNVIPGKPSPEILAEMLNPTSKKTIH